MTQLVREPHGVEPSLPQTAEDLPKPSSLLFPKEFDETNAPISLNRRRLMIFIDGANLFYAASQMGVEIDYAKLLTYLQQENTLIYAFFYTGVDPSNMRQNAFLAWMRRNGYRVITKDVTLNASGAKRVGSMNVEIAVDMVRAAQDCDTEILISGDGDLTYAVNAVSDLGTKVEVIALRSMTHDRLVADADNFIDILSIRDEIQKSPKH